MLRRIIFSIDEDGPDEDGPSEADKERIVIQRLLSHFGYSTAQDWLASWSTWMTRLLPGMKSCWT